jgi:hypothetical protein
MPKYTFQPNQYIAGWEETKWLVLSSFFYLIPAINALYKKQYMNTYLLIITSLVSANFWRKATYSWRRNLDLVISKISFILFFFQEIKHITYRPYKLSGYTSLFVCINFYYLSNKYYTKKNPMWYKYHFLFHMTILYKIFLIINSIQPKK